MTHRISMNTEQTRFDLPAMIQEWRGFLESQCGYEEGADPALVAVLAEQHHNAFKTMMHEEGLCWDELSGDFLVPDALWVRMLDDTGGFPYSLEVLDLIWADCFDAVSGDFDGFEEQVIQERWHGLV